MDTSGVIPQLSVDLTPPASSEAIALLKHTADFTFTVQQTRQAQQPIVSNSVAPPAMFDASSLSAGRGVKDESLRVTDGAVGRRLPTSAALAATGPGRLAAFLHAFMHQSLGLIAALVAALQRAVQPITAACQQRPASSSCGSTPCADPVLAQHVSSLATSCFFIQDAYCKSFSTLTL